MSATRFDLDAARTLARVSMTRVTDADLSALHIDTDADYPCERCRETIHGGAAILRDDRGRGVARVFSGYYEVAVAEALAASSTDIPALATTLRAACDEIAAWRTITGADTPQALARELADARAIARGKPTRGALSYEANKASATRVEAEEAHRKAVTAQKAKPKAAQREALAAAEARLTKAIAEERAAREAVAAFEREHGLPITYREHEGDTTTPTKEAP